MGYLHSLSKASAITFLVSQAIIATPLFAAGFQINEISTSLQGDALAGAAAANNDVSSMFINPATLSTLLSNQVYLGASEILPKIELSNASAIHTVNVPGIPPSSISAPVQGATSQHNITSSAFVPNGYLGWRFTDKITGGISVLAPYGLTTKYNDNSVFRFIALNSFVKSINITPAIAYAINQKWSVGLGFQAQYAKAKFSNFNGPYTGVAPVDALVSASRPTSLQASGWGYGYTLGALFQPDACTRFGLGYRSMVSEQVRGHGQQYVEPGVTVPAPSQDFLFNAETSVRAGVKTPAILTLSAAQDIYNWTIKATAQVNFWNTFKQLSIYMPEAFATNATLENHWQNSWFGSIGADYRTANAWTLRGGIAYDQTPTRKAFRDPRIPDADRYWLNIGASYQLNKAFSLDGALSHLFMSSQKVDVTQSVGTNAVSPTVPLEVNQAQGTYKGYANIVALALRYSF